MLRLKDAFRTPTCLLSCGPAVASAATLGGRDHGRWMSSRRSKRTVEVILLEDVEHFGRKGQVITVKPGTGRNFLIPHRLAKFATPEHRDQYQEMITAAAATTSSKTPPTMTRTGSTETRQRFIQTAVSLLDTRKLIIKRVADRTDPSRTYDQDAVLRSDLVKELRRQFGIDIHPEFLLRPSSSSSSSSSSSPSATSNNNNNNNEKKSTSSSSKSSSGQQEEGEFALATFGEHQVPLRIWARGDVGEADRQLMLNMNLIKRPSNPNNIKPREGTATTTVAESAGK